MTLAGKTDSAGYLPVLDGMRGIAITLVILCHLQESRSPGFPKLDLIFAGRYGVAIFFVLSGYLITYLLLKEEKNFGTFSLRNFFIRRVFRILPAAYLFLGVAAILVFGFHLTNTPIIEFISAAIFGFNYVWELNHGSQLLGHYWSLALEEQFYLIWPIVLLALRDTKSRLAFVALLLVFAPYWRDLNFSIFKDSLLSVRWYRTDLIYDPLLYGCGLALLHDIPSFRKPARRWLSSPLVFVLALGFCFYFTQWSPRSDRYNWLRVFSQSVLGIGITFALNSVLLSSSKILNFCLGNRVVQLLGKWSYGLYLWQHMFCYRAFPQWPVHRFPLNVIITFACAITSYYLVERPIIAYRRRKRWGERNTNLLHFPELKKAVADLRTHPDPIHSRKG